MYHKLKIICFYISFFFSLICVFPAMAQNSISISAVVGTNLGRTVAVPKNLHNNGYNYSLEYMPGYNWAGLLEFNQENFSITTGIGCKTLNFNFEQKYPYPYSYFEYKVGSTTRQIAIQRTLAMVRLNYLYLPLKLRLFLAQKQRIFITLGGEYGRLIDDVNMENIEWPGSHILVHEVDKWFKRNQICIMLGAGIRLNAETMLDFEIGVTPKRVDAEFDPTAGSEQGYFYFSKKLLEMRLTLSHVFFNFVI
ncbi:hypothetical protein L0128_00610 [candidate division KSB1 bacterium]|nr:hypothetical protein [candidate division KSB1 bacterium]